MHPDEDTLAKWRKYYDDALPTPGPDMATVPVVSGPVVTAGSKNLLSHIDYTVGDRNQHNCGNCWLWAATGAIEASHDINDGVFDRLSIQYANSLYNGGTGPGYACRGAWIHDFVNFYTTTTTFSIPWSNTNANWQDGFSTVSTSVPAGTIATTPRYTINSISDAAIPTQGVGQATAIANMKKELDNNIPIWFAFYLPNNNDWNDFFNFWNHQDENAIWDFDPYNGHAWVNHQGAGHAVLIVGYDDTDPNANNHYWLALNSWGTGAFPRPHGTFRIRMNMNYDAQYPGLSSRNSLYAEKLNIAFAKQILGKISGKKFNDLNGNGKKDLGDNGLAGWTIRLTDSHGTVTTATTDPNGDYTFPNLADGTYTVGEVLQTGWIQTAPAVSETGSATYSVTIQGGNSVTGRDFGNYKLGEINGAKFNDLNGNGKLDLGEPLLPGWTITLTGTDTITGKPVTKTAVTNAVGVYKITGLTKGTYTLKETLQPGWIQTYPGVSEDGSALQTVTIFNSGDVVSNVNFGNFKLGEINGMKFNDINGNSNRDRGDVGLSGWTITLAGTDDITGKPVTKTAVTDALGGYKFTGLTKGTYKLSETLQPGWIQTYPGVSETGSVTWTVAIPASGQVVIDVNFGNFKLGAIRGKKWDDLNANGKIDSFEEGLSGWTITLKGTDTITGTPVSRTATTDANGNYEFTGLTAGTYTVTETLKTDWVQTFPAGKSYSVTITSGTEANGKNFGNFHKGEIVGGGYISIPVNGEGAFQVNGKYIFNTPQGSIAYSDSLTHMKALSTQIKTVATSPDKKKGVITGTASINGLGSYPFEIYVEDNTGQPPGPVKDVFKISLPTYPYSKGNDLSTGDIQILK